MIKANSLESFTAKDLAQMAKRKGISGWHSMRKQELIDALKQAEKKSKPSSQTERPDQVSKQDVKASKRPPKGIVQALRSGGHRKDLSTPHSHGNPNEDRVALMVRDAYWLHAYWEINGRSVIRVRAAMAEQWHSAKPVLRVIKTEGGGTSSAIETVDRDIPIHGAVTNWYIDVKDPPQSYRVEIGYLAATGKFFGIARSNSVTTPDKNSKDLADQNWVDVAQDCDKILAQSGAYSPEGNDGQLQELFEQRLKRPMGSPMMTRYGVGAEAILERDQQFALEVNAELIVYGRTQVDAHITVGGDPVKLRPDGSFTMRMSLPDGRQVLPVISSSCDGYRQQTVILAVERNTKALEPVARDESH